MLRCVKIAIRCISFYINMSLFTRSIIAYFVYLGNYPSGYSGAYGEFFNTGESIDEFNPRTLYVGNLDATISEEFLLSLFSHIGGVSKCKIIHETASDPYAFVEFVDHASAVQALTAMNKRLLLGKVSDCYNFKPPL
ncbi:hypothetical protein D917_01089 [Trichinella nativa]|uniref:RRM domain-containing protein n=1 Tax=Trichinella nativa TaxID=6335 RepID=A0A1Y3EU56_9BILA|nr:hypothetical protein D917_01089 [Trichinella nativa]